MITDQEIAHALKNLQSAIWVAAQWVDISLVKRVIKTELSLIEEINASAVAQFKEIENQQRSFGNLENENNNL